jgi:transcriptional regulator with XRE-family HTH domain
MNAAKEIGSILRAKRKAKNLTQIQISVLAFNDEKRQSLISRIEGGEYKAVGFEDVTVILNSLGIDLIKLILKAN